jgi:hypothetical protein
MICNIGRYSQGCTCGPGIVFEGQKTRGDVVSPGGSIGHHSPRIGGLTSGE